MKDLLAVTGALADSNRVRALAACMHGELCVCQLIELLGLAPSTVSKHLSILKTAGLLDSRKVGRWMYYRLPGGEVPPLVREALAFVSCALSKDQQIAADAKRLKGIVRMKPEDLCFKQRTDAETCCPAPGHQRQKPSSAAGRQT